MAGRLILIIIIFSARLTAQTVSGLNWFTREKTAADGQTYLYTGMQDSSGKEIIPALYDHIWDLNGDTITLARQLKWNDATGSMTFHYQMITRNGFLYFDFPDHIEPIDKKENLILCLNLRTQLYGYLDLQGNTSIRFRFPEAGSFNYGLAYAEKAGTHKKGYIDKSGNWAILPEFEQAFNFSEGLAVVQKAKKWYFIDQKGVLINITGNYEEIFDLQGGFSVVTSSNHDTLKYGFINRKGQLIQSPQYEFLDHFEQGVAAYQSKQRMGMIDTTGKVLIPALYEELYRFDQNHYLFQLNGLKGLLSLDGKVVIPAKYSKIGYFSEGLCPVSRSGKWGFVDITGNEVVPCTYAEINQGFSGGSAQVKQSSNWWLVQAGDTLRLPDYDEVLPCFGALAPFRYQNHWGFLNIHGEEFAEPKFDELIFNKNGLIFARLTDKDSTSTWSVFLNSGKLVSEELYTDVVRSSEGFAAVKTKDGWGFINATGIQICSPHYTRVRNFSEGRAAVNLNGEWGFIADNGTEVIPAYSKTVIPTELSADSIQIIREAFPLFQREPVGDFKNNCACITDKNDHYSVAYCMTRVGKVSGNSGCEPYLKLADQISGNELENPKITILKQEGNWVRINRKGDILH